MTIQEERFKLPLSKRKEAYKEARKRFGHSESLGVIQLWNIHLSLKKVV